MKSILSVTALSIAVIALALPELAFAKARERFERTVDFERGGTFQIENKNGRIDIETWDESTVRIEAEKVAKSEEALEDIEIRVEGSGDRVSVETIHHRRRNGGGVSYTISLPTIANVLVKTANGAVTVTGVHGRVEARSVNGSLKIRDIAGEIEAETTNGSIRAAYTATTSGGRHRFSTTNGSVRLYLPEDAGGDLDAETMNGSIDVEFPVTLTRTGRRHIRGSFGRGDGSYEIRTVNGSVKILPN